MLDRVASLPGAPCLLARGTRLGGIALYHVNGSCRAIPASRGEINRENMAAWGKFFRSYHLPVLSAEQNDSQSEEINVIDESQAESERLSDKKFKLACHQRVILFVVLSCRSKDVPVRCLASCIISRLSGRILLLAIYANCKEYRISPLT